jgi:hypothetical protein
VINAGRAVVLMAQYCFKTSGYKPQGAAQPLSCRRRSVTAETASAFTERCYRASKFPGTVLEILLFFR